MSEEFIALTKKKIIDEIIIPNISSQYLQEFRLHSNNTNYLHELLRKLSDIIPEND